MRELEGRNEFFNAVKEDCLILVGSPTCQPCKRLTQAIDSLPFEGVVCYKVNIENFMEELIPYRIMSVPTLMFFKGGELIDRCGFISNRDLISKVETFLKGK